MRVSAFAARSQEKWCKVTARTIRGINGAAMMFDELSPGVHRDVARALISIWRRQYRRRTLVSQVYNLCMRSDARALIENPYKIDESGRCCKSVCICVCCFYALFIFCNIILWQLALRIWLRNLCLYWMWRKRRPTMFTAARFTHDTELMAAAFIRDMLAHTHAHQINYSVRLNGTCVLTLVFCDILPLSPSAFNPIPPNPHQVPCLSYSCSHFRRGLYAKHQHPNTHTHTLSNWIRNPSHQQHRTTSPLRRGDIGKANI